MRSKSEKKKSFGRSMVEMLGVLAIIAVLSIGGLWGYKKSQDSHQANDVLEDVRYMAGLVATAEENELGQEDEEKKEREIIVDDFKKRNPWEMHAVSFTDARKDEFAIVVKDVTQGACLLALNRGKETYKIIVNGSDTEQDELCGASNEMQFRFDWTDTSILDPCNVPNPPESCSKSNDKCPVGTEYCLLANGNVDCCNSNQVCDAGYKRCLDKCECEGCTQCYDKCCAAGEKCTRDGCVPMSSREQGCGEEETQCGLHCCGSGEICVDDPDADGEKMCVPCKDPCYNNTCCEEGWYCDSNIRGCKESTCNTNTHITCGTEGACCDKSTEICCGGACHPKTEFGPGGEPPHLCCGGNYYTQTTDCAECCEKTCCSSTEKCVDGQCVKRCPNPSDVPCPNVENCCSENKCTAPSQSWGVCCTGSVKNENDVDIDLVPYNGKCVCADTYTDPTETEDGLCPIPSPDGVCDAPRKAKREIVTNIANGTCDPTGPTTCCLSEEVVSSGHCCPAERPLWDSEKGKCVKKVCDVNDNSTCPGDSVCLYSGIDPETLNVYREGEDGCYKAIDPVCVKKPPLSSLKLLIGKLNGVIVFLSPYRLSWKNAQRFCESYGMHLADVQEACDRKNSQDTYETGYHCENLRGSFSDYYRAETGARSSDVWLNHEQSHDRNKKAYCNGYQVANSCGNNHYEVKHSQKYAACTFGTRGLCTAEQLATSGAKRNQYCEGETFQSIAVGNPGEGGECTSCDVISADDFISTRAECSKCNDRFFQYDESCNLGNSAMNTRCTNLKVKIRKELGLSSIKELDTSNPDQTVGHCIRCDVDSNFVKYSSKESSYIRKEDCAKCTNNGFNRGFYSLGNPNTGLCYKCSKNYESSAETDYKCSCKKTDEQGRPLLHPGYTNLCTPTSFDFTKGGYANFGCSSCVSCLWTGSIKKSSASECHLCDNRFMGTDNTCYNCIYPNDVEAKKGECDLCGQNRVWTGTGTSNNSIGTCSLNKDNCEDTQKYDAWDGASGGYNTPKCCWGNVYCTGYARNEDGTCPEKNRRCCNGDASMENTRITNSGQHQGYARCCEPDNKGERVAYCNEYDRNGNCAFTGLGCRSVDSQEYCSQYYSDEPDKCRYVSACTGSVQKFDRGDQVKVDVCCTSSSGIAYCEEYNSNGICIKPACCNGAVSDLGPSNYPKRQMCSEACTGNEQLYCYKNNFDKTTKTCKETALKCCIGDVRNLITDRVQKSVCCKPGVETYIKEWDANNEPTDVGCCGDNEDDEDNVEIADDEEGEAIINRMDYYTSKGVHKQLCCHSTKPAYCKKWEACTPSATETCNNQDCTGGAACGTKGKTVTTIFNMDGYRSNSSQNMTLGSKYSDKICSRNNKGYCYAYNWDTATTSSDKLGKCRGKSTDVRCCSACKEYDSDGGQCKQVGSVTPIYSINPDGTEKRSELQFNKCCGPNKAAYCNKYVVAEKDSSTGKVTKFGKCVEWKNSNDDTYYQVGHCCEGGNVQMVKNRDGANKASSTFFRNTCCKSGEVGYCSNHKDAANNVNNPGNTQCATKDDGSGYVACCAGTLTEIFHKDAQGNDIKGTGGGYTGEKFYEYKCCKAGETGYCTTYDRTTHRCKENSLGCCAGTLTNVYHADGTFYEVKCCAAGETGYCKTYKSKTSVECKEKASMACCKGTVTKDPTTGRDICNPS